MRACAVVALLAVAGVTLGSTSRVASTILTDGLRSVYPFEFGLVLVGTDSVELDGLPLTREDYSLDYGHGLLLLARRPPRWTVIRVTYAALPLATGPSYRLYQPQMRVSMPSEGRADGPAESVPGIPGDLEISGSKTVGVSIGGMEGSGLNQTTRLLVDGVVEGIRIDAELSDQSMPIPPEGTTLALDELDVIRIDLSGRDWRGRFGDVDFRLPVAGFGTLERRAVGGLLVGDFGQVGLRVGFARPRGRYARTVLAGVDGVQGPYMLAPDGRGATLIAGSEEVRLDGRRMSRGWDADYTIDYSTGELLFTNRHVLDRFSRIEATYQYMLDAWERSMVISGAAFGHGLLNVSADFFREGDDPDRGGRYELTPAEREYLADIGGDTALAWLDGAIRVGDSAGSYVAEGGHYRYVGDGHGDYRVQFTFVGESLGDYVYDESLAAHGYIGPGAGDYVAKYRVELPGRSDLGKFEINLATGGVKVGLAAIASRNSVNLLAPAGAPELDGAAAGWANWTAAGFELGYRGRVSSPGFSHAGGDSLVDIEYRWGGLKPERVRQANELTGSYVASDWLELGGDIGMLVTTDDSLLTRYIGQVHGGPVRAEGGRAGNETRIGVEASPQLGSLNPRAGWRQEWTAQEIRRSWEAGVGFTPRPSLEVGSSYRWLRADMTEGTASVETQEVGGVAAIDATWQLRDWVRASARVARQDRRYPLRPADDWHSWLSGGSLTLTPRSGLRLQGDLQQSRRLVQLRDEYYRYLGPGEGNYSRDSLTGRYYHDPGGAWERMLASRGSYVPADEFILNLSGDWSGWRPLGLTGTLSRNGIADSAPVRKLHGYNLRATVRALEPVLTAWLTASGSSTSDRTLALSGQASQRQRHQAELQTERTPFAELRLRAEYGVDDRENPDGQLDYTERMRSLTAEPLVGRLLRLEAALGVEWSTIAEPVSYPELGTFSLVALSGTLGRSWSFGGRWRLRARGGVVRRTASVATLPFDVALTRPSGLTPSAGIELSHVLSEIITFSGRYGFADRPDRSADHQFSAEMRAFF